MRAATNFSITRQLSYFLKSVRSTETKLLHFNTRLCNRNFAPQYKVQGLYNTFSNFYSRLALSYVQLKSFSYSNLIYDKNNFSELKNHKFIKKLDVNNLNLPLTYCLSAQNPSVTSDHLSTIQIEQRRYFSNNAPWDTQNRSALFTARPEKTFKMDHQDTAPPDGSRYAADNPALDLDEIKHDTKISDANCNEKMQAVSLGNGHKQTNEEFMEHPLSGIEQRGSVASSVNVWQPPLLSLQSESTKQSQGFVRTIVSEIRKFRTAPRDIR